jgi:peptidyl-prolyl cis-trans isomerase D
MPIMTRMRDNMPVILFGLLIAFLITIVFEWGMGYLGLRSGQTDTIGKVDGEKITYKEFSEVLSNLTENMKSRTNQEPDEATQSQLRDQAWDAIVTDRLLAEERKRMGLTVSDEELRDWVYGDNPPAELRKNFIDSAGNFNRQLYEQVLANPNQYIQDPRGEDQNYGVKKLQELEQALRQQRIQEKVQSLALATVRVSEGEVRQRFEDLNVRYEAEYAFFDPAVFVKSSDVQVTDADLKKYYQENIDQYKFPGNRTLKFVVFKELPSSADTAARRKEIDDAAERARQGEDFVQLTSEFSERPDSGSFFRRGELKSTLEEAVFAGKPGEVIGPIEDADGFHLVKILAERTSDNTYIHASHILLPMGGPDSNASKTLARQLVKEAQGGKDFAELARTYSKDAASAQRGGDLGWFTHGRMVAAFEKPAFLAKVGDVVGPIRTPFGLHIIKVLGRDNRELKLSSIILPITASSQTKNDIADRAKDFSYNARDNDFVQEAHATGLEVKTAQIEENSPVVPGVGINEAVSRWAFRSKVGDVSDPFTIENGSMVCDIAEVKDPGVKAFEEVKESIRPSVLRKKTMEQTREIAEKARSTLSPGDSLKKISKEYPSVTIGSTGSISVLGSVPGVGRDQAFVGVMSGLKSGEISPAFVGARGAYIVQLLQKTGADSATYAAQRDKLRGQILREKRNRFLPDWIAKLKEKAEIEDRRDQFYR